MTAPLVFLNGTSSAGKTSIAKAFQRRHAQPCLYASVDAFVFMLSDEVRANNVARRRVLPPVISAFHRSLPQLAACGLPVIIDHLIESREWAEECAIALTGFRAFFVGVHCPLEILEERERRRGDRLEEGRFSWPAPSEAKRKLALTPEAFALLIGGVELRRGSLKPWYEREEK